jgi:alkylation response protein AidB-like acyl-CoA dehydrogenase
MTSRQGAPEPAAFREKVRAWLTRAGPGLCAVRGERRDIEAEAAFVKHLYAVLWDSGFTRWGWPEAIGGRPGPSLLRAIVAEELMAADLAHEVVYATVEAYAPPVLQFSAGSQAMMDHAAAYIRGEELWCQAFSEPGAGSDLAQLSTRAERRGDDFLVNGQKTWTTIARFASKCVLLARTGEKGSAHRGITAFLVDMDTPGVEVRPIKAMHGEEEFCDVFFTDVGIPAHRVIGEVGQGWQVALAVLATERSNIFWGWAAWLHKSLERLIRAVPEGVDAHQLGEAFELVMALRARSRLTQKAMAEGRFDSASTSIDKVLMAKAHQGLYDIALGSARPEILFGDAPSWQRWRADFLYSRAASIYGGAGEIQRNIIAERLLGLPKG